MAAAPPAPGKKKAPAPSSTKALVAGDPKRLPRPPAAAAKGSNQKRRRLKAAQTEKAGRTILQSLRYYNSTLKFLLLLLSYGLGSIKQCELAMCIWVLHDESFNIKVYVLDLLSFAFLPN